MSSSEKKLEYAELLTQCFKKFTFTVEFRYQ